MATPAHDRNDDTAGVPDTSDNSLPEPITTPDSSHHSAPDPEAVRDTRQPIGETPQGVAHTKAAATWAGLVVGALVLVLVLIFIL